MTQALSAPEARKRAKRRRSESRIAAVQSLRLSDGRRLSVRTWSGTGPTTLVLLHGLLDSSEGWSCLDDAVTCRRIAFDLPGFGHSDAATCGSVQGYARDIADGLQMLGIERFTLVGHSLGGAVATALAELIPASVDALVLLAPAGFGRIGMAEAVSIPGVRNLVHAALPVFLSSRLAVTAGYMAIVSRGHTPERELVARVTECGAALVAGAVEGTRAVVNAGRARDAFHRRRVGYDGPVRAVWGEHDHLVPLGHRHGVRTAFPQAQIDVWQGMGHDHPRERLGQLVALLTRTGAAGTLRKDRAARRRISAVQQSPTETIEAALAGPRLQATG